MDRRLKEINSRLIEYSTRHFNKRIKISDKKDELDAISNGINMLGEELNDATISKIYFNSIFNSLSEMVFILNKKGIIRDVNKAGEKKLQFSKKRKSPEKIFPASIKKTIQLSTKIFQRNSILFLRIIIS